MRGDPGAISEANSESDTGQYVNWSTLPTTLATGWKTLRRLTAGTRLANCFEQERRGLGGTDVGWPIQRIYAYI